MTDSTSPPVPPTAPPKQPVSMGRRILLIAIALVVAIAVYFGVRAGISAVTSLAASSQKPVVTKTAAAEEQPATDDGVYTSVDEGYSVAIEGEPQVGSSEDPHTVQSQWMIGTQTYGIFTVDLPDTTGLDIDAIRQSTLDGIVSAVAGSSLRESSVSTLDSEPANIGTIDLADEAIRFAIAVHNDRAYVVMVTELDDTSDEDFVSSFVFTD